MSKPIERPPTLLGSATYLAGRVSKKARGDMQRALGEHEVGTSEYGVLVALGDFGALSQQQLADRLDADKSHVVRLIDDLEARGLVERAPDPGDRRRHQVDLTAAGERLRKRLVPSAEGVESVQLEALSPAERRSLIGLLQRVLDSQDRRRPGAATRNAPDGGSSTLPLR